VRPHIKYANVVWGPRYIDQCQVLERVQRRPTKFIPEFHELEYDDSLDALNIPSLSYRRNRANMIIVYKILHRNDN